MTFKSIFLSLTVLFTVYSIHLKMFPGFLTPRIFLILLLSLVFFKRKLGVGLTLKWDTRDVLIWGLFNVGLLIYSFIITLGNNAITSDYSAFTGVFNYFLMVVFFSSIMATYFSDEERFCNALIIATLIQSIIVIASLLYSVRAVLETIQYGDIDRYANRVIGLGITGATGSVYLFTGLFANAYMILFKKIKWKYIVSFLVIFVAITLVARTGYYISFTVLLFILFIGAGNIHEKGKRIFMIFALSILLGVIANFMVSSFKTNTDLLNYTIGRLDEIFSGSESKTLKSISNMNIPSVTLETLIGTGVRKGYTSIGEFIWHDSGYVQRYMSIGLIMALMSYLSLAYYLKKLISKVNDKNKRRFFNLIFVLMLAIEIKEPFIFTLAYPFVLIILLQLTIKAQFNNKEIVRIKL